MINRRGFIVGLLAAPVIIRTPGLLMPVRPLVIPQSIKLHLLRRSDIELMDVPRYWTSQRALASFQSERADFGLGPKLIADGDRMRTYLVRVASEMKST